MQPSLTIPELRAAVNTLSTFNPDTKHITKADEKTAIDTTVANIKTTCKKLTDALDSIQDIHNITPATRLTIQISKDQLNQYLEFYRTVVTKACDETTAPKLMPAIKRL
jgi:hypothetical protein